MEIQEALKFFNHFSDGVYVKTLSKPIIHGFFTDKEKFKQELSGLNDETTLYFIAHGLKDISGFPDNCFESIQREGSVKTANLSSLKYFLLDIDPNKGTEIVGNRRVKRNLTIQENSAVIEDAKAIKNELFRNGFDNIGVINSGNGAYLIFPFKNINIESDEKLSMFTQLFKEFAYILKRRVNLRNASIDFKTIKPSQCFKLPGTMSTKGEATENNPYRHACIVEDWDDSKSCLKNIKEYVETYDTSDLVTTDSFGTHLNIEKCMEHCEKAFPVFYGGNHDFYGRILKDGCCKDMLLDSSDFMTELRLYLRKETGMLRINNNSLAEIIEYLKDQAYQCYKTVVASRAYYDKNENAVFYDMCNDKEVVKVTATGITLVEKPLGMFVQQKGDKPQIMYKATPAEELPKLLGRIAKLSSNNLIILSTFLCACFLGNCFPTPMLLVTGPQGSSKSTLTRFIQSIVHPQVTGLLSLLEKKDDIAIALSRRLLTCFDNATGVKPEISDMLCTAITKGTYQKRELYTTRDECLIEYTSIIVINGIDVISRRTDLMERCIMLEMSPIKPEERKTEKELQALFEKLLPSILGAIFNSIQKALAMDEIELPTLSRMADFESWSARFSVAMGYTPEQYQEALQYNLKNLVDAVSFGNPTIFAVVEMMRGKCEYTSSVQNFYHVCDATTTEKLTSSEKSVFPKSPAAFSRSLSGMTKNLQSFGISFDIKNVGPNKEITLWNDGTVIENKSQAEKIGKIAYENRENDVSVLKAADGKES